jgi:hypothetical protein
VNVKLKVEVNTPENGSAQGPLEQVKELADMEVAHNACRFFGTLSPESSPITQHPGHPR